MLTLNFPKIAYVTKAIESIGERIYRSRKAAGMTQVQLGAAAGISASAVTQWENGTTKSPKPDHLFKIARALGKSPEWLITGRGAENNYSNLSAAFSELPDDSGQQALDFLGYHWERAEGLIASEKVGHYVKMIEDFKRDLDQRKKK